MATNSTNTSRISASLAQLIKDAERSAQVIKLAIADNLVTEKQGQEQLLAQQRTFQEQHLVLAQRQAEQLRAILATAGFSNLQE